MDKKKVIGVGATFVITGIGIYKLLSGSEPQKYSRKWFETVSDEVLNAEREIIRKQICSAGHNISLADSLGNLLHRFDTELSKRAWGMKFHMDRVTQENMDITC